MKTFFFCLMFMLSAISASAQVGLTRELGGKPDYLVPQPVIAGWGQYDPFWACIHSGPDPASPNRYSYCNQMDGAYGNIGYGSFYPQYPTYGYGDYGYGGYGSYFYPGFFLDKCLAGFPLESRPVKCVRGEVKFDIERQNRRSRNDLGDISKAEVFIDGVSAGQIGKYSHRITSGLSLDINTEYKMEVVWSTKQGIKTIVRRIKLASMDMQDGPYWYPVSEELFANAAYGREVEKTREKVSGKELILGTP